MQIIKNKKQQEKKIAGFTLIEMLAVLFIAVLMSTAILVNYNYKDRLRNYNLKKNPRNFADSHHYIEQYNRR